MKITAIEVKEVQLKLTKPYRIANHTIDRVANCIVTVTLENGITGLGAGAPIDFVTGETMSASLNAFTPQHLNELLGSSIYCLPMLATEVQKRFKNTPAAAAALDIALYDAYGKCCQKPLVDILGRAHTALPTSITLGIKDIESSLLEAKEYYAQGFKNLKVKLGENVEEDVEKLYRINELIPEFIIRVDMNQGYSPEDFGFFMKKTDALNIELIEQPFNRASMQILQDFTEAMKAKVAADESLISVEDAFQLICPEKICGIFNIKLMKCGGISPALKIAALADYAQVDLMWGCMDESIISISAALHTAFACPRTKYLDLDGSFDLAEDLVKGGFILNNGLLRTTEAPGLGVQLLE